MGRAHLLLVCKLTLVGCYAAVVFAAHHAAATLLVPAGHGGRFVQERGVTSQLLVDSDNFSKTGAY